MKTGIATIHAPKALGPYSQGISTGQLVFTSGQLGLIPETGVLAGPDVESQARKRRSGKRPDTRLLWPIG